MQDLIRDLYLKYAPNENIEDKLKYIQDNYGDDVSAFVNDFYSKYAPEKLNKETFDYINATYFREKITPEITSANVVPKVSQGIPTVSEAPKDPITGETQKASYEQMRDIKDISQMDELKETAKVIFSPTALASEISGETDVLDIDEAFKMALSTPVAWLSDARRSLRTKKELYDRYGIDFMSADIPEEERKEIERKIDVEEMQELYSSAYGVDLISQLKRVTSMSKPVKEYQKQVKDNMTKYDGDIIDSFKKGNFFDAGVKIVNGMVETSPSFVAAAGGMPGLLTMGAGMYGNKFEEVFKNNPDKAVGVAMTNAGSTAAVEVLGGLVTRALFFKSNGFGFGVKGAGKKTVEDLTKGSVGRLVNTLVSSGIEGTEELLVETTAEIIDRVTLEDQSASQISKDIFKIMRDKSDAFILGTATGGTMSTMQNIMTSESALKENAINMFMSKADRDYLTKKAKSINNLQI